MKYIITALACCLFFTFLSSVFAVEAFVDGLSSQKVAELCAWEHVKGRLCFIPSDPGERKAALKQTLKKQMQELSSILDLESTDDLNAVIHCTSALLSYLKDKLFSQATMEGALELVPNCPPTLQERLERIFEKTELVKQFSDQEVMLILNEGSETDSQEQKFLSKLKLARKLSPMKAEMIRKLLDLAEEKGFSANETATGIKQIFSDAVPGLFKQGSDDSDPLDYSWIWIVPLIVIVSLTLAVIVYFISFRSRSPPEEVA